MQASLTNQKLHRMVGWIYNSYLPHVYFPDCRTNSEYITNGTAACSCWTNAAFGMLVLDMYLYNFNQHFLRYPSGQEGGLHVTYFSNCQKCEKGQKQMFECFWCLQEGRRRRSSIDSYLCVGGCQVYDHVIFH